MKDRRSELDTVLRNIINITDPVDGDCHVYFQPPESRKMKYPAIRYSLTGYRKVYANNGTYRLIPSYEVILIDHDPDSMYAEQILQLSNSTFDRTYVANNLNHFVFTLH